MELFKLSCAEVQELKDQTLDKLISFNRELKMSFSSVQQKHWEFKETVPDKLKHFSTCKSTHFKQIDCSIV